MSLLDRSQERSSVPWIEFSSEELSQREVWGERLLYGGALLRAPERLLTFQVLRFKEMKEWSRESLRIIGVGVLVLLPALVGTAVGLPLDMLGAYLQNSFSRMGRATKEKTDVGVLSLNACIFPGNWNAFFGQIPESGFERLERFVALFKQEDPDLICLTEVFDPLFANKLAIRLRDEGWNLVIFNPGASGIVLNSGLFIASRVAISKGRYIDFGTGRGLARGLLQMRLREFDLFLSHFSTSESGEMKVIEAEVERPTLFVGDLNTTKERLNTNMESLYKGNEPTHEDGLIDWALASNLQGESQIIKTFRLGDAKPLTDHHALITKLTS